MTSITRFAVGDIVRMNERVTVEGTAPTENPYPGTVGKTATVVAIKDDGRVLDVDWHEPTGDHGRNWGWVWFALVEGAATEQPEEAPQRPLVHFDDEKAGRDRSAAREACAEAVSKVLKPEHNTRLRNAAAGESVDAYDLNEAITAAIRSAATRHGQSTARRAQAKRFAHVAHIVQAVLENHADNLPGYEPGARSRLLEDAHRAITEANSEVVALTHALEESQGERTTLTQAASDERRRLCEEIDTLRANLSRTIREANESEAALNWLLKDQEPGVRHAVEAFLDGFRVGASDD